MNINLIDLGGYLFMSACYLSILRVSTHISSYWKSLCTKWFQKFSSSINIRNSQFIKKTLFSYFPKAFSGKYYDGLIMKLACTPNHCAHSHMILLWAWADCVTVLSAGFLSYKIGRRLSILHIVFVVQNSMIMQV